MVKSNSDEQSLLLSALQRTTLSVPHSEKWQKDTAFQQPTPTTIILFPPAQKGSAHQVINELRLVTSFSEAGISLPDQYLKLKSSSVPAISIALWLCSTNLCSSWLQPHRGLWSFSFSRQDSMEAVQVQHLLITLITNYTHDLSQKVILHKVPGVLGIKASMAQQSPRHGIGSTSAVTVFEPNLIFFLPSWPLCPQKAQ